MTPEVGKGGRPRCEIWREGGAERDRLVGSAFCLGGKRSWGFARVLAGVGSLCPGRMLRDVRFGFLWRWIRGGGGLFYVVVFM